MVRYIKFTQMASDSVKFISFSSPRTARQAGLIAARLNLFTLRSAGGTSPDKQVGLRPPARCSMMFSGVVIHFEVSGLPGSPL